MDYKFCECPRCYTKMDNDNNNDFSCSNCGLMMGFGGSNAKKDWSRLVKDFLNILPTKEKKAFLKYNKYN